MNLTITKNHVYDYAAVLAGRAGAAQDNYAATALTEDNYPVLDAYLASAVAHAETELRRKIGNSHSFDLKVEEKAVVLQLASPVNEALINLIETGLRLYMGFYVCALWLQTTAAGQVWEAYMATASRHLNNARVALSQPKRFQLGDEAYGTRKRDDLIIQPTRLDGNRQVVTTMSGIAHDANDAILIAPSE